MLHPEPAVDRLWNLGLTSRTPLVCSAGRTGFYIDGTGDYWKCGAVAPVTRPIGNILRDGELRFAASPVCERFPTQEANPGSEIQCWCAENRVLDITRASTDELKGLYDAAFFHIDVSRVCNYSCHYCTVPKEIFDHRKLVNKRDHLPEWARKPYLDAAAITTIADAIFAKCDNVTLRLAGLMEPLMNPDILTFFEIAKANEGKLREIRLMSNLGIEKTFDTILEMGFGPKLTTIVSMHITDDNFDPFRVVRQIKKAEQAGTNISSHIVPSPLVRRHMVDYLDFFSIHGIRVRPVPYIVEDPNGHALEKHTQHEDRPPKHVKWVQDFLGGAFADRLATKNYAQYVAHLRELNADTYRVAEAFDRGVGDGTGIAQQKIYTLKSAQKTIPIVTETPAVPMSGAAPAVAKTAQAPAQPSRDDSARADATQAPAASVLASRQQAYAAIEAGRAEDAFALLEAALALDPQNHELVCDLAMLAHTHGEHQATIDFARHALSIEPGHGPSRYLLGMALAATGGAAEAIALFEGLQARLALPGAQADDAAGFAQSIAAELDRLRRAPAMAPGAAIA